jgi:hypothetical protein
MHIDGDEALARPGASGGDVNAGAMLAPESWTTEPDGFVPSGPYVSLLHGTVFSIGFDVVAAIHPHLGL